MAQATISIRTDKTLKERFDSLCEEFGLSTTAAINIFMKAVVREKKIPFEISANKIYLTEQERSLKGLEALEDLQQYVAEAEIPEMTLEEINAEIQAYRNEIKSKK